MARTREGTPGHGLLYGTKSRGNNSKTKNSLREIFPTDAGQLSNRLKFLAGQNKFLQDRKLVFYQITIFLPEITGHLSDKLKFSAGQIENLPVLSDSPAVFVKTAKMQEFSSLLMTHLLSVMHALVKFHEYISYGLGVMARTQLTVWN